jgi:AraC-like DNA-binding protein/mannose-6-phosphate isomerase-like protein (cupin superfamily)
MTQLEFARIHEMQFHGDIRFHLRLHEMTKEPFWSEPVPPHWHEEYEFLVITKGTGTASLNTRTTHIAAGDILFINAGIVHSFRGEANDPLGFFALDFGRELLSSYGNDDIQQKYISRQANGELIFRDHFRREDPVWECIHAPLEEIHALCAQNMEENELLIKSDLLRIWHYLCRDAEATAFSLKKKNDEKVLMIKQILQYIQESYAQNLTLSGLAERFHMSEGQFCRFFKSQISMTAIEYLNYYRIGVACDRLKEGTAPISDIALECGYNNISYFNRTFRRYMHCTPGEYRERGNE